MTLRLAIPADFAKVTFANEFFGRRFSSVDGHLVTSVPWPPGQRELRFSYLLANTQRRYVWQRTLDLPGAGVRVVIHPNELGPATADCNRIPKTESGRLAFESGQRVLPARYVLRVESAHMPVSPMNYAPWAALATLAAWSWQQAWACRGSAAGIQLQAETVGTTQLEPANCSSPLTRPLLRQQLPAFALDEGRQIEVFVKELPVIPVLQGLDKLHLFIIGTTLIHCVSMRRVESHGPSRCLRCKEEQPRMVLGRCLPEKKPAQCKSQRYI